MAKATTTIRQVIHHTHGEWLHANQVFFNKVTAFYFEVIQAHVKVLDLSNKEALTVLENLTHTTDEHPHPVLPLCDLASDVPAMFRRAAINAALGSARSFFSHLEKWHKAKEKAEAKRKKFKIRPPVPPRTWNKSVILYSGMWKERTDFSLMIKVWTGTCWSWIKVWITGRAIPDGFELCSPQLVYQSGCWHIHTPIEKKMKIPGKIENQLKTGTRICAVDLNINEQLAVCTIRDVEGSILATTFIGGGRRISGFRKKQLGRIARNRHRTGVIAENEQDNADLWRKIRNVDEHISHLISRRIVQFAQKYEATVLVFEHLGNLKPSKEKYSRRGNEKRAYWMKGRIFKYAKYKAFNSGILTTRVSPRNTSRECARCGALVARYSEGQEASGYTYGAPLVFCAQCGMRSNADRNASLMIGNRLFERFKEKPQTHLRVREERSSGGVVLQEPNVQVVGQLSLWARHEDNNGHGNAQSGISGLAEPARDFTDPLRDTGSRP